MKKQFLILIMMFLNIRSLYRPDIQVDDFFRAVNDRPVRVKFIELLAGTIAVNIPASFDKARERSGESVWDVNFYPVIEHLGRVKSDFRETEYPDYESVLLKVALKAVRKLTFSEVFDHEKTLSLISQGPIKRSQEYSPGELLIYYHSIMVCAVIFKNAEHIESYIGQKWAPSTWWAPFRFLAATEQQCYSNRSLTQAIYYSDQDKGLKDETDGECKLFVHAFYHNLRKRYQHFPKINEDDLLLTSLDKLFASWRATEQ